MKCTLHWLLTAVTEFGLGVGGTAWLYAAEQTITLPTSYASSAKTTSSPSDQNTTNMTFRAAL